MFTIEQSIRPKLKNQTRNDLWKPGMALAKQKPVKGRFSYKELTVILGIVVALLVVLTLWIGQQTEEQSVENMISLPEISFPSTETVKKTMTEVVE